MTTKQQVLKVLSHQMGVDESEITDECTKEKWEMDSLDDVEIVMALEDEFDCDIADADALKWNTVKDVVDYFEARAK